MSSTQAVAHALLLLAFSASSPAAADPPPWLEKWLWNPVERTARGIEVFAAGDSAAAVGPLLTARRLAPSSPIAGYNAGTARFVAASGDPERALELLGSAARAAAPELAADAWYNLGTARLAAGDLEQAVAALEEALRRQPGREDAKVNLELALRRASERQPGEGEAPSGEPPPESREPEDPPPAEEQEPQDPGEEERPLPRFRDLPDMTAEEAAAILQAIENMEREQRREDARRDARTRSGGRKDW